MPETNNRKFKILGAGWLVLGGLWFALAFMAFVSVVQGDEGAAFESGDKWWIVVLVLLVLGAIQAVNGLTLLRRNPVARPLIAISSSVLLIPSAGLLVPLLVVGPAYGSRCQEMAKRRLRAIWQGRTDEKVALD